MISTPIVVLLVEDNPDHVELIRRGIAEHGEPSHLKAVQDGQAALEYLENLGPPERTAGNPRPDLILLDLRLPKRDGLEVLERIKSDQRTRSIPVVILTTSDSETDISSAYQTHANSYLVKPLSFDLFTRLMSDLAQYWLRWNRYARPQEVSQ